MEEDSREEAEKYEKQKTSMAQSTRCRTDVRVDSFVSCPGPSPRCCVFKPIHHTDTCMWCGYKHLLSFCGSMAHVLCNLHKNVFSLLASFAANQLVCPHGFYHKRNVDLLTTQKAKVIKVPG